jgi:intracellular multiplication protein IcmO
MEGDEVRFDHAHDESEEIDLIAKHMTGNPEVNPIERGVSALLAYHNRHEHTEEIAIEEQTIEEESDQLSIFKKVTLPESVMQRVGERYFESFSAPLASRAVLRDKIELLERVLGRSGSQANNITQEIIKDIHISTIYPPQIEGILLEEGVVISAIKELNQYIESLKEKAASGSA